MTRGVYPGSFNPPTVAHVAVAEAARRQHGLDRVDLAVSRLALDKEHVERPRLEDRLMVLGQLADRLGWLGVVVTDAQLLADIATGYDLLIVGADKWSQLHDVRYYGSAAGRDAALRRLPAVAVAPRPPHSTPDHLALDLDPRHAATSSTAARAGALDLMIPEAVAFDALTGAWTDMDRYDRWRRSQPG
jgi:hypothetical protein